MWWGIGNINSRVYLTLYIWVLFALAYDWKCIHTSIGLVWNTDINLARIMVDHRLADHNCHLGRVSSQRVGRKEEYAWYDICIVEYLRLKSHIPVQVFYLWGLLYPNEIFNKFTARMQGKCRGKYYRWIISRAWVCHLVNVVCLCCIGCWYGAQLSY